jgi:hypothetical protein
LYILGHTKPLEAGESPLRLLIPSFWPKPTYILHILIISHMGHFPEPQQKKAAAAAENCDFVLALISKPFIRIS